MIENRDFVIDKNGRVTIGDSTTMNDDVFNIGNTIRFLDMYERNLSRNRSGEQELSDFLDEIFHKRFKEFTDDLSDNKIDIDDRVPQFSRSGSQYIKPRTVKEGETTKPVYVNGKLTFDWNPFYRGYYFGQFVVSNSMSNMVFGSASQFKDAREKSKRNKNGIAMGWKALTGGERTLGHKSNIVKVRDLKSIWEDGKNLFGINDPATVTDGLIIISPLEHEFLVESTGGENSIVNSDDAVLKRVGYGVNYVNGTGTFIKSSEMKLTGDHIDNSKVGMNMLEYFLTGGNPEATFTDEETGQQMNLFDKYMSYRDKGLNHSDAIREVKEYIIKDRIATDMGRDMLTWTVGGIHMVSTHKADDGYTNDWNPFDAGSYEGTGSLFMSQMDNDNSIIQLQPFHEHQEVSKITQQEAMIGIMNSEAGAKIDAANQILAKQNMKRIKGEIKKKGLLGYMRELAQDAVERMNAATSYIDMLNNSHITFRYPTLRSKGISELNAEINKGIQTKRTGVKLVQQPDFMFDFVESIDEHGNPVLKSVSDARADGDEFTVTRHLNSTRYFNEKGEDLGAMMQNELDKLKSEGKNIEDPELLKDIRKKYRGMITRIMPAEVIVPANILADFINHSLARRIGKSQPTLNDLLTIKVKGATLNVRSFIKSHSVDYYHSKEDGLRELDHFLQKDTSISPAQRTEMIQYYGALLDKLDVYYSRIPATMPSAGGLGEIMGITYDSKGIIYTSPLKNLLDGSDYDVDTLTVLFRSTKRDDSGRITIEKYDESYLEDTEKGGLYNYIFDVMRNTYLSPDNLDYTTRSLSVNDMKKVVEEKKSKSLARDYDPKTNAENFIQSHEGKQMVSRFANQIHLYSRLLHISDSKRGGILKGFKLQRTFQEKIDEKDKAKIEARTFYVIENLAKMLQASVDNAKELIIGYLNINRTSGNIVSSLVLSNYSLDEIYQFLNDPSVAATIHEVAMSESIDQFRTTLQEVIERKLGSYKNLLNEEALKKRKEDFIASRQDAILYYKKLLAETKDDDDATAVIPYTEKVTVPTSLTLDEVSVNEEQEPEEDHSVEITMLDP
ncbi:MAG TPA: hypothetical protein PKK33_09330, partial [Candidatus Cloacimonadota bacterium]|nr:hypothetical protein [Candidatus Cloacimonadota bacterium]